MSLKPIALADLDSAAKYLVYLKRVIASEVPAGTPYNHYPKFKFFSEKKVLPVITFGLIKPEILSKIETNATAAKVKKGRVQSVNTNGTNRLQFDKGGEIYRAVIENTYRLADSVVIAADDTMDYATELPEVVPAEDPPVDLTKAKKEQKLGNGSFGEVYRISSDTVPGKTLVLKTATGADKEKGLKEMQHEADMYKKVGPHPNIASCYGIQKVGDQEGLVLEEVKGGKLEDIFKNLQSLKTANKLSQAEYWAALQHVIGGTLRGLAALESVGIVHNDVKDDNVLFDPITLEPKIVDFGLSSKKKAPPGPRAVRLQAPEVFAKGSGSKPEQDAFSTGQMLHEQTQGGIFAHGMEVLGKGSHAIGENKKFIDSAKTFVADTNNRVLTPAKPGPDASKPGKFAEDGETQFVEFMNLLMHPDPKKRLTPSQALKHPFLQDNLIDGGVVKKEELFAKLAVQPSTPSATPSSNSSNLSSSGSQGSNPPSDPAYQTADLNPTGSRSQAVPPRQPGGVYDAYQFAPSGLRGQPAPVPSNHSQPSNGPADPVYVEVMPPRTPSSNGPVSSGPYVEVTPSQPPPVRTQTNAHVPVASAVPGSLFGRPPPPSARPPADMSTRISQLDTVIADLSKATPTLREVTQALAEMTPIRAAIDEAVRNNQPEEAERQIVALKQKLDAGTLALYTFRQKEQGIETAVTSFKPGGAAALTAAHKNPKPEFAAIITAMKAVEQAASQDKRAPLVRNLVGAANAYLLHWKNYKESDKKDKATVAAHAAATSILATGNQVAIAYRALGY